MEEIWKDVKGYEGYYQVSNFGQVRSIDRIVKQKSSKNDCVHQYNHYAGKILKQYIINSGYYAVDLCKNHKSTKKLVHRLVAEAFLENKSAQVNHKDENKLNNNIENLEWCTAKYNMEYNDRAKKIAIKNGKSVIQYDLSGNILNKFVSSREASFITNIPDRGIRKACYKTTPYKGYIWKYEEEKNIG